MRGVQSVFCLVLLVSASGLAVEKATDRVLDEELHSYIYTLKEDRSLGYEERTRQIHAAEAVIGGMMKLNSVSNRDKLPIQKMVKTSTTDIKDFLAARYGAEGESLSVMLKHALATAKQGMSEKNFEQEMKAKPITKERAESALDAVRTLRTKLQTSQSALTSAEYSKHLQNLQEITHDIRLLERTQSPSAQADLTKAIQSRMNAVRAMADKIEAKAKHTTLTPSSHIPSSPSGIHKSASHHNVKKSSTETSRDLEESEGKQENDVLSTSSSSTQAKANSSPNGSNKPTSSEEDKNTKFTQNAIASAKSMLAHAKRVSEEARLVGKAKEEMNSNIAHMKTDLDMMQTTVNVEAIGDLQQAMRMRNDKVAEVEKSLGLKIPSSDTSTPALIADNATLLSVKKLLRDLETTPLASTEPGQTSLSALRSTMDEYEKAESEEERGRIAGQMQEIISKLQKQSAELEEAEESPAAKDSEEGGEALEEEEGEKGEEAASGEAESANAEADGGENAETADASGNSEGASESASRDQEEEGEQGEEAAVAEAEDVAEGDKQEGDENAAASVENNETPSAVHDHEEEVEGEGEVAEEGREEENNANNVSEKVSEGQGELEEEVPEESVAQANTESDAADTADAADAADSHDAEEQQPAINTLSQEEEEDEEKKAGPEAEAGVEGGDGSAENESESGAAAVAEDGDDESVEDQESHERAIAELYASQAKKTATKKALSPQTHSPTSTTTKSQESADSDVRGEVQLEEAEGEGKEGDAQGEVVSEEKPAMDAEEGNTEADESKVDADSVDSPSPSTLQLEEEEEERAMKIPPTKGKKHSKSTPPSPNKAAKHSPPTSEKKEGGAKVTEKISTSFYKSKAGKIVDNEIETSDNDLKGLSTSSSSPSAPRDLEQSESELSDLHTKASVLFSRMSKHIRSANLPSAVKDDLVLNAKHIQRDLERIMKSTDTKERADMTRAVNLRLQQIGQRV